MPPEPVCELTAPCPESSSLRRGPTNPWISAAIPSEAAFAPKTQPAIAIAMTISGAREKIVKYARDAAIRIPLSARKPEKAVFANAGIDVIVVDRTGVAEYWELRR